ncbi:MAG: ABC transporter permease, partial [Bryobacteraceae bacterium]
MSLWSRLANTLRGDRSQSKLNRELAEELESHIAEAIEHGRDPAEARRAFGSPLRQREESRDVRVVAWLDSLRADAVFGWRQLKKNKVTTLAAILSLGLAIGACTSAFRLIDALLLRPLPVASPNLLYAVLHQSFDTIGVRRTVEAFEYPVFPRMREAVKGRAEMIALSHVDLTELTYGTDQEMEKARRQYVSGWMFATFGLRPALGRLLTENDDQTPGASPVAVLSYDYWNRRFGRDPNVIGRTFHMVGHVFEIVGVAGKGFTGTAPGTVTDIFIPAMMHPGVTQSDWSWVRIMTKLQPGAAPGVAPGVAVEPVRQELGIVYRAFQQERAKGYPGMPAQLRAQFLDQTMVLEPASAGYSGMQKEYGPALAALGVLVALVLLIACANVANLLLARSTARQTEFGIRAALGASPGRLSRQLILESLLLAALATLAGLALALSLENALTYFVPPTGVPVNFNVQPSARVFL